IWNGIAARIATEPAVNGRKGRDVRGWFAGLFAVPRFGLAFSGAMAVLVAAVLVGYVYLRPARDQRLRIARLDNVRPGTATIDLIKEPGPVINLPKSESPAGPQPVQVANNYSKRPRAIPDDPGVLFADAAYTEIEEKDTASHLEQAQKLLVSFRSLESEGDQEVDVAYEKSESRRLLSENVVLRRDAENAGKFPTKSVLGSLEPFLIDIANLPDKAPASDVRQIKDRVQRTEIVAELRGY